MVDFPPCKINLGLRVLNKRTDGFHNIETIFYPVPWYDALEVVPDSIPATGIPTDRNHFSFETRGLKIDGSKEDNLCMKAFRLLQEKFKVPSVKICLLKNIPVRSGLGGGSSDGAFTLKLVNDLFHLKISIEHLKQFASQLGSDCTFFIEAIPCLATGRGDQLQPITLDLSAYYIIIVHPPESVSTAWAYASVSRRSRVSTKITGKRELEEIIHQPVESWKKELKNDFEEAVFKRHPEIAKVKTQLYEQGALYASMSGSGSAVYGIFKEKNSAVAYPETYKIFKGRL